MGVLGATEGVGTGTRVGNRGTSCGGGGIEGRIEVGGPGIPGVFGGMIVLDGGLVGPMAGEVVVV